MYQSIMLSIRRTWKVYESYISKEWSNLSPEMYAGLLILILVAGWLMMRNGTKHV